MTATLKKMETAISQISDSISSLLGKRGDFSGEDYLRFPYESPISDEVHDERRSKIEEWMMGDIENTVSPAELNEIRRKATLTPEHWNLVKETPRDYWPLAYAYNMNPSQQTRFLRFVPKESEKFQKYMRMQRAWIGKGMELFYLKNKRIPNYEEENIMVNSLCGPYRVFSAFKTYALNEEIDYPWADEAIRFKHSVQNNNMSGETFIPG